VVEDEVDDMAVLEGSFNQGQVRSAIAVVEDEVDDLQST
jgi:hypothetical protein